MIKAAARTLALLLLISSPLVLVAGCAATEKAIKASSIEVTDQLGRAVSLEKTPKRIVSLAPSNTEILFALGLGEMVVGVTKYCNFPPEAKTKEQVGGFSTPDLEKVVALSPDIVLATSIHEKKVIPELERRNLTVAALAPNTLEEVLQSITLVGKITGVEERAQQLVKNMVERIKSVTELTAEKDRPRVFYITWHDPLKTVGHDTRHEQLITIAGGENIFRDLEGYPTVDLELVLERNPQIIIAGVGMGSGKNLPFEWAQTEPRLKNTEALQQGKVYEIDVDLVGRPGPRIVEALEQMVQFIHPELASKQ